MARIKGSPKTGGRKKGVPNKVTASVKEAFAEAFDKMGGAEALLRWGALNQTDFYKLASKLIPTDLNAKLSGDINVIIKRFTPDPQGENKA
jgi:hypothetical protein